MGWVGGFACLGMAREAELMGEQESRQRASRHTLSFCLLLFCSSFVILVVLYTKIKIRYLFILEALTYRTKSSSRANFPESLGLPLPWQKLF